MNKRLINFLAAITALFLVLAGRSQAAEDHSGHDMHQMSGGDTFIHHAQADGINAEFQVMSLASMNMKDEAGATHHVMVSFFGRDKDEKLGQVAGKVKVIAPSGKEQEAALKDFGGVYAANFSFDEPGKWGVICLFKVDGAKQVVKFWYPHEM